MWKLISEFVKTFKFAYKKGNDILVYRMSFPFFTLPFLLFPKKPTHVFTKPESGTLAAHRKFFLVLLRSRPDTFRRFPLRKTQNKSSADCYVSFFGHKIHGFYSISFFILFVKHQLINGQFSLLSAFFRSLKSRKKSDNMLEHISSKTPLFTRT